MCIVKIRDNFGVGGFNSVVTLQLHKLETRVRFPPPPSGLVAQFCNPATRGQGYLDGAGHLGLLIWLGLDWLVSLLGLEQSGEDSQNRVSLVRWTLGRVF